MTKHKFEIYKIDGVQYQTVQDPHIDTINNDGFLTARAYPVGGDRFDDSVKLLWRIDAPNADEIGDMVSDWDDGLIDWHDARVHARNLLAVSTKKVGVL